MLWDFGKAGQYTTDRIISFADDQERAEKNTRLYTPDEGKHLLNNENNTYMGSGTRISVTEETTQKAAHRLIVLEHEENPVLLNFASARHPGGGFITGSKAQEEDLCRCSGLYNCLARAKVNEYYRYNRSRRTPLYSDYTIYSPKVPWFRKNRFEKPNDLFLASIITSPAPNRSHLNQFKDICEIERTLRQRAGIILAIAQENFHRNLILGAWGCGVFKNHPPTVADAFREWLSDVRFACVFDHVTFAIYCPGKDKSTFEAFKETFKKKE